MSFKTPMGVFKYMQVLKYSAIAGTTSTTHNVPVIPGVTRYGILLIGGGAGGSNKNGLLDDGTNGVVSSSGSSFYDIINTGSASNLQFSVGRGGDGAPGGSLDLIIGKKGVQTTVTYGSTTIHASGGGNIHPIGPITESRFGFKQPLYGVTTTEHNVDVLGPGGSLYTYYGNRSPTNLVNSALGADGALYGQGGQGPGRWLYWTGTKNNGGKGGDGLAILFWNDAGEGPITSNVYYNDNNIIRKGTELYYNDNNVIRAATEMWYNNNGTIVQVYGATPGIGNNELLINEYIMGFTTEYGFENSLFGDSGTANGLVVLYHRVNERAGKYSAQLGLQTFGQIPNTTSKFVYTAKDNTWVSITYEWKNGHYLSTTVTSSDYQWFRTHNNQVVTVRYNG